MTATTNDDDDLLVLAGMTETQVNAELRAMGIDPEELAKRGEAFACQVLARVALRRSVMNVLELNSSRCCDDEADRRALAEAIVDMFLTMGTPG